MYCIDNIIYDLSRNPVCKKIFNLAKYENRIKIILAADDHIQNLQLNNELDDFASKPIFMPMAGFFDHCLFEKPHKIKKLCVIGNPSALKVANVIIKDDMIKTAEENNFLCLSKKELSSIVDGCSDINFSGNVVNVILDRLKTKSLDLLDDNLLKFSASIDSFIRVNTRLSAIRSLIGTPIDFYGSGWDDFFPYEKNFEFKGLISHFDIPKICTKYKAVINFDPNFENGVHDRIFTALGVGTKVITNKNIFLNNIPEYFSLIKTFDINNPDLRLIAESILMEKEEYFQNNLLFQKHSWPSRINDLLTTLRNDGVT